MAKILTVSVTIGSGGSGSVFAPSLFVGAMLGTVFGSVANILFPAVVAPAGAYGLVGMAAVFRAEYVGFEALSRDTIYTLKLRRRGIDLRAGRDVDLMRAVPVAHAMTSEVATVSA